MGKSLILVVLALCLLFPNLSSPQIKDDVSQFDGNGWLTWEFLKKLTFIAGFIAASGYIPESCYFSIDEKNYDQTKASDLYVSFVLPDENKKMNFSQKDVALVLEFEKRLKNANLFGYSIVGITTGQIVDGLNLLFADFKNRQIKLADAIYVVRKQIKGASKEEIEAVLQYLRSDKDYKKLIYKDNDGKAKFASFP